VDSDGDGVTDLGEVEGTMTDPNDPESTIAPGDFFVVLPFEENPEVRTLRFGTEIQLADVYFLIDTTVSMRDAIDNVRSSLSTIALEIQDAIPDVQMGVGRFEDFPLLPPLEPECFILSCPPYGGEGAVPFEHVQDLTASLPMVQSALDGLEVLETGGDCAESAVEALYQTATGEGGSWEGDEGDMVSVDPRVCSGGRAGYPCFRRGAQPVVVLVSDAEWHEDHEDDHDYEDVSPSPHTFPQASMELQNIGARVISVITDTPDCGGAGGQEAAREMARQTGTVSGRGTPLVFETDNGEVSTTIIDAIESLATGTPQDVGTRQENVSGNPDDFDATQFITRVTPREGFLDGMAGQGYQSKNDSTFVGVIPGTEVEFEVEFENTTRMGADEAEIFRAKIVVVGNGVTDLDERNVFIVVPPEDEDIVDPI
jgi:hypothetical protein